MVKPLVDTREPGVHLLPKTVNLISEPLFPVDVLLGQPAVDLVKPAINLAKPQVDLAKPLINLAKPAINLAKPLGKLYCQLLSERGKSLIQELLGYGLTHI